MGKRGIIFAIVVLAIANLPYFLHMDQDLYDDYIAYQIVNHNEASYGMNAKDIILFGRGSLEHDRIYIVWALNVLLALISFFLFGISLVSLRLPYIMLNVLANILFFDSIRRTASLRIAASVTLLFAYYPSRMLIGKSAMAEALVLPLVVIICWLLFFRNKRPNLYFLLGGLATLAGIVKLDNLIAVVILSIFAILEDREQLKNSWRVFSSLRIFKLLVGCASVFTVWSIFGFIVGIKKFIYYYAYELGTTVVGFWPEYIRVGKLGSLSLAKENLIRFWETDPLLVILITLFLLPVLIYAFKDHQRRKDPFFLSIIFFLGIFIFKISFSRALSMWHLAPIYPLCFFMFVYIITHQKYFNKQCFNNWAGLFSKIGLVLIPVAILFLIAPFCSKVFQRTRAILLYPKYSILLEAQKLKQLLNPGYRLIFAEGHFTYYALLLPFKCYDVVPNIIAKDFFVLESDPQKIWEVIQQDPRIAYVMFRQDNQVVKRFVESILGAQLITQGIFSSEPGYLYQIRWPYLKEDTLTGLRGQWELSKVE